ncbi:hypothetical protein LV779_12670 [Streptomyces thinghirensis]|nr:hypothetical protein [Streptomyces thinghirensis]
MRRDVEALAEQGRLTETARLGLVARAAAPVGHGQNRRPPARSAHRRRPPRSSWAWSCPAWSTTSRVGQGARDAMAARVAGWCSGSRTGGPRRHRADQADARRWRRRPAAPAQLRTRGCPVRRRNSCWRWGVPAVLVDRRVPLGGRLAGLDSVRSDHVLGSAAAVHHLAGLGHDRIALLAQDNPTSPQVREGSTRPPWRPVAVGAPIVSSRPEDPAALEAAARAAVLVGGGRRGHRWRRSSQRPDRHRRRATAARMGSLPPWPTCPLRGVRGRDGGAGRCAADRRGLRPGRPWERRP